MSEIDREQVRHVARLARLELSEEEVDRLSDELGRVLSRFRELEEAEVDGTGHGTGEEPAGESPGVEAETDGSGLRPDEPDADPLARFMSEKGAGTAPPVRAVAFSLMSSRLRPEGAVYEELARYPMMG